MADNFYVELFDHSYNVTAPTPLKLKAQRYSGIAVGGYEQAQIDIIGTVNERFEALRWLGYYVKIKNKYHQTVWFGKVTQATINLGGLQIGKSLDEMSNRIAVAYSYNDSGGVSARGTTDWTDDTESQDKFGIKELLQSDGDMDATQAESQRDKAIDALGKPITTISISQDGGGDGDVGGTLTCKGLWQLLSWRIYNQLGGVERYDVSGNFEHLLGWGMASNVIGFEQGQDRFHDLYGRLKDLRKDDQIVTSGAANAANNGTFKIITAATIVTDGATTTYVNYPHATISFDPVDDIHDSLSGLGFVGAYELLKVSGSSVGGNNRYYYAKSDLSADHITVDPGTISTSFAGPTITIEQGHSIGLDAALTTEYPSNTITVEALGKKIAQSFTLSVALNFTVAEVFIRAKRVGSPVDNLTVTLYTDSAGSPGSSIETVSMLGSLLTEDMDWRTFTFNNTNTLVYGTTYWIVVARSGSNTTDAYYTIDLDEDEGYATGGFKLWDGSAWVARAWGDAAKSADMPFQVWGHRQTSDQINDMLTYADQFFDDIDIQDASLIYSRQYRDQDQSAQDEIETLMKAGISSGKRLLASVTPDRVVHVYDEPVYSDASGLLANDGSLRDVTGGEWPSGKLPHGTWLTLTGVPANVDAFSGISPVFIDRAEFDCSSGKFSALEPKGAVNPWDVVKLA